MTTPPAVSVVIPTYKRPDLLAKCLDSLAAQDPVRGGFEVIVVDDCSGPETEEVLQRYSASVTSVSQPVNRGPAAARNRGVGLAGGRTVLFLDDDIVATPSLVAGHARFHERVSAGGSRSPSGVVGHVSWHPDLEVSDFMSWLDTTDLQFAFATLAPGPLPRPWEAFYTCNLSLPRSCIEAAGGFDERFPYPAFEDIDLGVRLARSGFTLSYEPALEAWHSRAVTLDDFCRRMTLVGRSGALLKEAQPDLPFQLAAEPQEAARWKGPAARVLAAVVSVTGVRLLRERYFRYRVGAAYQAGVRSAAGAHSSSGGPL